MALRDDGLWAVNVEWTGRASEFLRNREYRYFSPAFDFDAETRRITELVNVALTNLPATKQMQPLVASRQGDTTGQQEGAKQLKGILAALGLAETATEGEAVAALTRMRDVNKDLLALAGKATASEARQIHIAPKNAPTLADHLMRWLKTVVKPFRALKTYHIHKGHCRIHIVPVAAS